MTLEERDNLYDKLKRFDSINEQIKRLEEIKEHVGLDSYSSFAICQMNNFKIQLTSSDLSEDCILKIKNHIQEDINNTINELEVLKNEI